MCLYILQAMQSAALDEQHVVLCIEHCWISYILEIMNPIEAVLEGSEIPNLFGDDLESIAKPLKSVAQQEGFQDSLGAYFWSSKKHNPITKHRTLLSIQFLILIRMHLQGFDSVCILLFVWKVRVTIRKSYLKITHRCTNALKSFGWPAHRSPRPNTWPNN